MSTLQNEMIMEDLFDECLCELEQQDMIPVLLNTSFNIKGKPILTRYSSAFEALETTELDCLFLDKKYLIKNESDIIHNL